MFFPGCSKQLLSLLWMSLEIWTFKSFQLIFHLCTHQYLTEYVGRTLCRPWRWLPVSNFLSLSPCLSVYLCFSLFLPWTVDTLVLLYSYFVWIALFVDMTKCLKKATQGVKGLFWLTIWRNTGYQAKSLRRVVSLCSQFGSREKWVLVCSLLFPLFGPTPSGWDSVVHLHCLTEFLWKSVQRKV